MDETDEVGRYVSRAGWLSDPGRGDLIDEIADEFERRAPSGRDAFWARDRARDQNWRISLAAS